MARFRIVGSASLLFLAVTLAWAGDKLTTAISFEENKGQWPAPVLYATSTPGYRVFLRPDGLQLSANSPRSSWQNIELHWVDSSSTATVTAEGVLPYRASYFMGSDMDSWKTSVQYFRSVHVHNLYPGISVDYHQSGSELEQDIDVDPGADVRKVRFEVKGANEIAINKTGQLELRTEDGSFVLAAPYIYQIGPFGKRTRVAGSYVLEDHAVVAFRLGKYDRRAKLIIDPVLSYSTYLPKINGFPGAVLSVNSTGAACVTDGTALYGYDANGNVTFTVSDTQSVSPMIIGMAVFKDEQGNCFLAGRRQNLLHGPENIAGIAKFSPTGSLLYAAYFGGVTMPQIGVNGAAATGVVADSSGNALLVGATGFSDFPLKNPIQNLLQGSEDVFLLKLDPMGSNLVYSTYFGSNNTGPGNTAIATDSQSNAYIAGSIGSFSIRGSIPVTPGAFQGTPLSGGTAWVAKIDPAGAQVYGTYLGGTVADRANAIAVDASGNAYVVGVACSPDFPTKNAFQPKIGTPANVCGNGFLSKLTPDGSALVYSTFLGGADPAQLYTIAVDSTGAAYVAGEASGGTFPLASPVQADFINSVLQGRILARQGTVSVFNSSGSALQYSTFLGGFDPNFINTIGVDSAHNVYVGGTIVAVPDFGEIPPFLRGFPILAANNGLLQPFAPICIPMSEQCTPQGFVAKISPVSGTALASNSGVDFGSVLKGTTSATVPTLIANVGSTDLQVNSTSITGDYSITSNTCGGPLLSAKHCEIDLVFKPTAAGTRTGALTVLSTAPDSPRNIQLTGIGRVPLVSLSPASLNLTSPAVGTAGPPQTITVSNVGVDVANISALAIVGPNDFSETHTCASTLAVGLSCQITVTYKASTANPESASVQLTDDAAGSPQTVALSGIISAFGLGPAPGMPSSLTISAGQTATFNLVVGGPGFSGNVSLSCSGAPTAANCSVPGSVSLSSTPTPFQVTVTTTARSTAVAVPSPQSGFPAMVLTMLFLGLFGVFVIASGRARKLVVLAGVCLCVIAIASCGGSSSSGGPKPTGTPAGTYTLTVTANGGGATQSMNLTLGVN